jgi:TonB family protein
MNSFSVADELDQAVEKVLAGGDALDENAGLELGELAGIAEELRYLPQPEFKAQLKAQVTGQPVQLRTAWGKVIPEKREGEAPAAVLPSLFRISTEGYPMQQRSLAASVFVHAATLALVVVASVWAARPVEQKPAVISRVISLADYPLPPAQGEAHGGGGSGSSEKLRASTGAPPRFSHEQFAPPRIVVENEHHNLTVDPTVIGPPNVIFPKTQTGDLFSKLLIPSNGTGTGGGIGDNHGTGAGSGRGPGVGPGEGGNMGGGMASLGGGVSAPRPIYDPEPEYSEEARREKYQGDVILSVVVGADGLPRDVRVLRSLGMGLDEKAMQAVRTWRFQPAMKDGRPVMVQVNIQVSFRLF